MRGIFIYDTFTPMIRFPNCKINLGLSITRKREDDYHELDTVFYPIPLCDALEFIESDELKFDSTGLSIPGYAKDNIVLKAYHALKRDFPTIPNLHIHLLKHIPTGGGLGGGSSDAAFMLMMMNEAFNLNLNTAFQLASYSLALGSDCPFFLHNEPCYAKGRGEQLSPIPLDLSAYSFMLVLPGIHVPTGWAFTQVTPARPLKSTAQIAQQPITTWKDELKNDFEEGIFKTHPILQKIKDDLYHAGAVYASMSGSGSTMYAIIEKSSLHNVKKTIEEKKLFEGMDVCYV